MEFRAPRGGCESPELGLVQSPVVTGAMEWSTCELNSSPEQMQAVGSLWADDNYTRGYCFAPLCGRLCMERCSRRFC